LDGGFTPEAPGFVAGPPPQRSSPSKPALMIAVAAVLGLGVLIGFLRARRA
jgi:hypothetical protein